MSFGISLVICTYNGVERLKKVFDHLVTLDIPKELNWEVLVIDNASTDETSNWVAETQSSKNYSFPIYLYYEQCPGLNNARITGAKMATHDWLLFCDDDNLLETNYIRFWLDLILEHKNLGAVGGRGIPLVDVDLPEWFEQYAHSYAVGPQMNQSGFVPIGDALYGAGLFIFKKPILKLLDNGFEMIMSDRKSGKLTSGGDLEWCYLIQLAGLRLYYDDRLIFQHKLDASRLTWYYYKKLKAGIASGVGLLESYNYIFKNDYKNSFSFLIYYCKNLVKSILVFTAVSLKAKLSSKKLTDLGLIILKSKAESYCVNLNKSYMNYKQLKKTFGATV